MNILELKTELHRAGAEPTLYSLNKDFKEGSIAISQMHNGRWWVYYYHPGVPYDTWSFDSESEACENLLERVLRIVSMRQKYGRMNKKDVKIELDHLDIEGWMYNLEGSDYPGDQIVLCHEAGGKWAVFYTERGERSQSIDFDSESAACEHLLDRVLKSKQCMMRSKFPKTRPDGSFCVELEFRSDKEATSEHETGATFWLSEWTRENRYWVTRVVRKKDGVLDILDEFSFPQYQVEAHPASLLIRLEGRPGMMKHWGNGIVASLKQDVLETFKGLSYKESRNCSDDDSAAPST
jgi:hypothetical protein